MRLYPLKFVNCLSPFPEFAFEAKFFAALDTLLDQLVPFIRSGYFDCFMTALPMLGRGFILLCLTVLWNSMLFDHA